jgi:hypothetical protein
MALINTFSSCRLLLSLLFHVRLKIHVGETKTGKQDDVICKMIFKAELDTIKVDKVKDEEQYLCVLSILLSC